MRLIKQIKIGFLPDDGSHGTTAACTCSSTTWLAANSSPTFEMRDDLVLRQVSAVKTHTHPVNSPNGRSLSTPRSTETCVFLDFGYWANREWISPPFIFVVFRCRSHSIFQVTQHNTRREAAILRKWKFGHYKSMAKQKRGTSEYISEFARRMTKKTHHYICHWLCSHLREI